MKQLKAGDVKVLAEKCKEILDKINKEDELKAEL